MSQVLSDYPRNAGFANGLFVTAATDHKNNLNSSSLKKNYALRPQYHGWTHTIEILDSAGLPTRHVGPRIVQVIATIAYGIQGLRRGETTWDWPTFNDNPEQENLSK